ncbi:unnamed protein product [Closterium sp. NIES-54]
MWGIGDGGRVLVSGTITAPPLRRSTRITRGVPPIRYAWAVVIEPAGLDDEEEDKEWTDLDPDVVADPERQWDTAKMIVKEAFGCWKGDKVKEAMDEEMRSLIEQGTWELVPRPPRVNVMKNRWILNTKFRPDGIVEREKARLVVKGFTQEAGVDYEETYAPVGSYVTARVLLAIAAALDLDLMQLDVKNAFLHGVLDRDIYMEQPSYYEDGSPRVCKLVKSLYGLKQSPMLWYEALDGVLKGAGWKKSQVDEALYFKSDAEAEMCWLLVYVDDLLAASRSQSMLGKLRDLLQSAFQLREISPVHRRFFDGEQPVRVPRTPLSSDPFSVQTFEDVGWQSRQEEEYRQKVGSLQFAAYITRPDISFAYSKLGSGQTVRSDRHWRELDRCLAYLVGSRDVALEFGGGSESLELVGYAVADDAGDKQNRTSTGGYVFVLGGAAVSWASKRIRCATLSSTESEYVAVWSSPPLVLCELGEYRCPPGYDGHYHHSWESACDDLHVHSDGASPGHIHSSARVAASCSCRLMSHQNFLWHHRLGHTSLPRLRGMHSRLLHAAPHSSSFPPTTAPLQTLHMDVKGQVVDVLIPWIRTVRLQLRERFGQDLPIQNLHSDRGGEFSSNLFRDFCRGEGILQSFTLPDSPQRNGIVECRIGLVMEVARTSMIHAAAPHFLWPFAVWGSRAFVRDTSTDKLSARAIPYVFLGFVPDAPGWLFYHRTSRRVFPSQDITFDESVPFYHPLPPQGRAPSGVSQVDPLPGPAHVWVAVSSGAARGTASGGAMSGGVGPGGAASGGAGPGGAESEGAETGGAKPWGVEPGGGEPGGAEPEGVEPGGSVSEGAESGGAEPQGAASSGDSAGASPRLSPLQLREWFVQCARLRTRAGGAGVATEASVPGDTAVTGPGGARTRGTGATGSGGVEGAGAGDPTKSGATGAGSSGAGGAGAGGARVGGAGAGGAGVGGRGVGGAGARGAGAVDPCGPVRPRPYFIPLLQQLASPLPAPYPYTEQSGGLTERREPASRRVSPVRTARLVPRTRPPPIPGTHAMTLRLSSVPLRVPLPAPPESSLPEVPDPESDRARAASPTVSHLLATAVTDPLSESAAVSALVAELLEFAAACCLDVATALVADSASASPPSVGGECALGTDVLEDRQEDFECITAAVPRFASLLLALEEDPDAPDIPTPRSYVEGITGPYSSQWQATMDAAMASWKSTGTFVDEVPPPGANIVDGMWIFRVKRPPGSPPAFKARYVARGFSQQQGVDYFQTFSPTPRMTTLRVLLHVAAQRDYELHSLDFSTAFLQGSLHEEIRLHHPPGFTESFPAGTKWSLRRPVYGLRQAPREWHDTLRTTLAALGFAPATADPSLFLRTDTSLPPFYVLVHVHDLVFATADTEALTLVKLELQKRHTCTDLGELRSYLGLQITWDRARRTITLTQSYMVHQVLQRFGFQFSSPQPTPLSTNHSLSALPLDESVEPSGPYPGLVGCLMYLMTCTRPDLAYPLSLLARYVALGKHQKVHWDAAKRVLHYSCNTLGMGLVIGGRGPVVLTGHADSSWVDDSATKWSSQGYTFSLGSGSVSWRSTRSSSVLSFSCEAEIYAGAMATQELRWLTYLMTDLGEQPRSPPFLYVDNNAMIALCHEHRLEHTTKHIALQYFLARELQ